MKSSDTSRTPRRRSAPGMGVSMISNHHHGYHSARVKTVRLLQEEPGYLMRKTRLQDALGDATDLLIDWQTSSGGDPQSISHQHPHATTTHPKKTDNEHGEPDGQSDSHPQLDHVLQHITERNLAMAQDALSPTLPAHLLSEQEKARAHEAIDSQIAALHHQQAHVDDETRHNDRNLLQDEMATTSPDAKLHQHSTSSDGGAAVWYSIGKLIGKGTFGLVHLATHRITNTSVAIKSYCRNKGALTCSAPPPANGSRQDKRNTKRPPPPRPPPPPSMPSKTTAGGGESDALEWKRVRQEVKLMGSLHHHPGVAHFIQAFETPTQIQVVMEHISGGSLCDLLKRSSHQKLSESSAKKILRQLCGSIAALHHQNVIHRDLKLENVLLDSELHPKVIDFGFSQREYACSSSATGDGNRPRLSQTVRGVKNFCGTPSYMAPEVVCCKSYDGKLVDIWSFGVILYTVLCGKFPFHGLSLHQLYQNIRSQQLIFPLGVSKSAQHLISSILVVDPQKRLSLEQIQAHPWLVYSQDTVPSAMDHGRMFTAFMDWETGLMMVCAALSQQYGLPADTLASMVQSHKSNSVTALIRLVMLDAERLFFFRSVRTKEPSDDTRTTPTPTQQQPHQQQQQEKEKETKSVSKYTVTPAAVATTHKQQLEQLIGLVKHSLR